MNLLPAQLLSRDRVPVFDPEDCNLRLVALSEIDPAKYTILDVPRFLPRFDIYGSNDPNTENTYAIVSRAEHAGPNTSFLARLYFNQLGWWHAGVLRVVGKGYRQLWIGPIPACARLD